RLLAICLRLRPDIIHTNIGPVSIGFWAAKILGIAHVWHLREYQDLDFGMRYFPSKGAFIRQLSRSNHVVCVTRGVAEHFDSPPNATVVCNGVALRDLTSLV